MVSNKIPQSRILDLANDLAKKLTADQILEGGNITITKENGNLTFAATVPTKVSELENDQKFQTEQQVTDAIGEAIGRVLQFNIEVVDALPEVSAAKTHTIYLVKKAGDPVGSDIYDEYLLIEGAFEHIGSTDVDLSGYLTKADAEATYVAKEEGKGLSTNDYTTEEKEKLAGIEADADVNLIESIKVNGGEAIAIADDKSVDIVIDKATVGLDKVDNTADADKPVSTATQAALDLKADATDLDSYYTKSETDQMIATATIPDATTEAAGKVELATQEEVTAGTDAVRAVTPATLKVELDKKANAEAMTEALAGKADLVDGKIPEAQLPSYVDDVLEYADLASFPEAGESGKIYVALDDGKIYRWSGSAYAQINGGLVLGETEATAFRGDQGKVAYDHSQLTSGNPHQVSYAELTGTNPSYTKEEADNAFVAKEEGKGLSTEDFTTELKTKLEGVEADADVNLIESVKVNGEALVIAEDKSVDVTVPTKTSDLENDNNFMEATLIQAGNNVTIDRTEGKVIINAVAQAGSTVATRVDTFENTAGLTSITLTEQANATDITINAGNTALLNSTWTLGADNKTITFDEEIEAGVTVEAKYFVAAPAPMDNYATIPQTISAQQIAPNTLNVWGEVAALDLTFAAPISTIVNEYAFVFSSGDTPTTLTLPDNVKWMNGTALEIKANKKYLVSVIYDGTDYLAIGGEF